MYTPPAFVEDRPEELAAIIRAASLPVLVTPAAGGGLLATHLPLTLAAPDRLIGHIARANNHWRDADPEASSLAVFTAAEGYISPSWYATKAETGKVVPTWNYQAVHATGRLEFLHQPEELLAIVAELTNRFEQPRSNPWSVTDAPPDYMAAQLKGIVGVVLHIEKLQGVAKLSQNKTMPDRLGAATGLATENPKLAAAMRWTG